MNAVRAFIWGFWEPQCSLLPLNPNIWLIFKSSLPQLIQNPTSISSFVKWDSQLHCHSQKLKYDEQHSRILPACFQYSKVSGYFFNYFFLLHRYFMPLKYYRHILGLVLDLLFTFRLFCLFVFCCSSKG